MCERVCRRTTTTSGRTCKDSKNQFPEKEGVDETLKEVYPFRPFLVLPPLLPVLLNDLG